MRIGGIALRPVLGITVKIALDSLNFRNGDMKTVQDFILDGLARFLALHDKPEFWSWSYWTSEGGVTAISTLAGALVGALVAGSIQARVSRTEFVRNQEQRTNDRTATEKAVALRISSKVFTITNQLSSVLSSILQSLEEAHQAGNDNLALWQRIVPVSGIPSTPSRVDDDEIAFMFGLAKPDLALQLSLLSEKFYSFIESVRLFNQRRTQLTDLMSATLSGPVGTTVMTEEEYRRFAPRMYELKDIAAQIRDALLEDLEYAMETATKIGPEMKSHFNDDKFPVATFPKSVKERMHRFRDLSKSDGPSAVDISGFNTSATWKHNET